MQEMIVAVPRNMAYQQRTRRLVWWITPEVKMGSVYSLSAIQNIGDAWSNGPPLSRPNSTSVHSVITLPSPDDSADVAGVPILSKVEALDGTNPTQFQKVVTDAVAKLKVAAEQSSDPFAASYLWDLANRFQLVLDSAES
jgi:hypothetical protein